MEVFIILLIVYGVLMMQVLLVFLLEFEKMNLRVGAAINVLASFFVLFVTFYINYVMNLGLGQGIFASSLCTILSFIGTIVICIRYL